MKKIIFLMILLIFVFSLLTVHAEKLMDLGQLTHPQGLAVKGDQIYIVQDAEVFVFSGQTMSFVNKFGRKGNGPGEFNPNKAFGMLMQLRPMEDGVFLFTSQKCGEVSRDGTLRWEKRFPFWATSVSPLDERLVLIIFTRGASGMGNRVVITDREIKEKKQLAGNKIEYKMGEFVPVQDYFNFQVHDGKIYLLDSQKGLSIQVFNAAGEALPVIRRSYEKVKVDEGHKQQGMDWLKSKRWFTMMPPEYKKNIVYPEYLPVCKNFVISGDRIYVHTYKKVKGRTEFLVIPVTGTGLEKIRLPVADLNLYEFHPYSIDNGRYYHIVETGDEDWELHVEKISTQ
jgi:hypothetical protein